MEKYTQFRDRGTGTAPFLPIPPPAASIFYFPLHAFLFCVRLSLLIAASLTFFGVLQWLRLGSLVKKGSLWTILGIPGIWWVDLQVDGIRKGSIAKHRLTRLPQPGSIIAASFTSPIDALYLAAIFDPVFTVSYPYTRKVRKVSLLTAILRAFSTPELKPPPNTPLTDIATLLKKHPKRSIAVFSECTTTNGLGILRPSPSLVTAHQGTKIFPISLRYNPADITTPIPHSYITFLWNLLSRPTHTIRVRIAEPVVVGSTGDAYAPEDPRTPLHQRRHASYDYNYFDTLEMELGRDNDDGQYMEDLNVSLTDEQKTLLGQVGEALARLGRSRRVGFGAANKLEFVRLWNRDVGFFKRGP